MNVVRLAPLIHSGPRLVIVALVASLGVLVALVAFGLFVSGGQPAQLVSSPKPTIGLMPMGNAHIPTTNECLLCHGAAGELKPVPAILHPLEGWRRCVTCHTDADLGRVAPGHAGIPEEECLNCHKVAQGGPAITAPHARLQSQQCLSCHGNVAHLPGSMASSEEKDCVLCHKPTELPPPAYPHEPDSRLECSSCHRSPEAGNLPIDHARRTDDTCLLCHDIHVAAARTLPPDWASGLPPASGTAPPQ